MQRSFTWIPLTLAVLVVTSLPHAARGQFTDLLERLPAEANTLVVLNAETIFSSPLAIKEGWKQRYEKAFAAAPMLLPPTAEQFVMASKLELEYMEPKWEVAVVKLSKNPTTDYIATRIKGTADRLAGVPAVEGPNGGFIVKFAPSVFGMIGHTDRQEASRWVNYAKTNTSVRLSPYLQEAAGYAETVGTHIILALDLHDVLRAADIKAAMANSPVVKERKIDVDKLSVVLSSIQGATLGVLIRDKAYGKLKLDFGQDAAILSGFSKELILEVLGEAGAMIDEFKDWKPEVKGKRVSIEGYMTDSGLRRVLSILELDTTKVAAPATKEETAAKGKTPEEVKAYTSRQYFLAVNKYLKDLKVRKGAKSIGQYGLWFEKYASKIDKLPILNVDPAVVDYGQTVSNYLRDAVTAIQGIGIRSGARTAQVKNEGNVQVSYGGYGRPVRHGAWGGWRMYGGYSGYAQANFRNVNADRRAIRREERAKGAASARDIMKEITLETNKVRRAMTEKYQVEF